MSPPAPLPSSALPALRRGQVAVWKDDRGFGFIRPDAGGADVFLHISALRERPRRPREGDIVCYHVTTGPDGKPRAQDAVLLAAVAPSSLPANPASVPQLTAVVVLTLAALAASGWYLRVAANPLPLLAYLGVSAITYGVYAHDKSAAGQGAWRVPESTLHGLELIGGWPGAGIAQQLLRHKNRKLGYQIVFWGIIVLHAAGWCVLLTLGAK